MRADDVTLVVATRNRPERLDRCLRELRAGSPDSPVIVCDDGSQDPAVGVAVARHPGVRLVTLTRCAGAAAARNVGMREARTPLVAFCDDDAWWAAGALDTAAARFAADPRLGLLAAHVLVGEDERPDPVTALMARGPIGCRPAGPEILGFVAVIAGWVTTEVGRQPYTVYGLLRTADSVSPIAASAVATSLTAFVIVYFAVFGIGTWYILQLMARPPHAGETGAEAEQEPRRLPGCAPSP